MALAPKHLLSVILLLLILILGQGALLYRLLHDQQIEQREQHALAQQEQQLAAQLAALQTQFAELRAALAAPPTPPPTLATVPIGGIVAYAGAVLPPHWLPCVGQTLQHAEYPQLHAALSPQSDDSTFTLPDLRGRVIVGLQPEDPDFQQLSQTGGEKAVTLKLEHLPPHSHTYWRSQYAGYVYDRFAEGSDKNAKALETPTSTVGEGKPHNNLQPYLILSFIIRAQ